MLTKIYALKDETGKIRYVGRTTKLLNIRLSQHLSKARSNDTSHRCNWIRTVFKRGFLPEISLLGEVSGNGAREEAAWVEYFKEEGLDLVNSTDGGDGCPGLIFSPEALKKIGDASRGRPCRPETRQRLSEALLKRDPAVKKRISETMKRWWAEEGISPETRGKLSIKSRAYHDSSEAKNKIVSEETRKKISAQVRSRGLDWHKKLSESQKGRVVTLETRRKISDSNKRRCLTRKEEHLSA